FLLMALCVINHLLDFLWRWITLLNCNLVLLLSCLIKSYNRKDTILIQLEAYLNLRNSLRCLLNSGELHFSKETIVLGERSFSLIDRDYQSLLEVMGGSEGITLVCWNRSVTWNDYRHTSSNGLNTQAE